MHRTMVLPLLLALIAGCVSAPQHDVTARLGEDFSLGEGQAAYVPTERMLIRFEGITEDSRCPSDVVCVWAGQVTAEVSIAGDGFSEDSFITLGAGGTAESAFSGPKGSYLLELVSVKPYPLSTDGKRNYTAGLRLTRVQ